jgi:hypothetical protein
MEDGNVALFEEAQKIVSGEYSECSVCDPDTCIVFGTFNQKAVPEAASKAQMALPMQSREIVPRNQSVLAEFTTKLKAQERILSELNVPYYIYAEPEIVHQSSKDAIRNGVGKRIMLQRYRRDGLAEVDLLDAFQNHSLRTRDPAVARIFLIPTSTTAVLTTYGPNSSAEYQRAFDALINTTTFKATRGNRHVMLSLALPFFTSHHSGTMKNFGLTQYYNRLYNVTVATDHDATGCRELLRRGKHLPGNFGQDFQSCSKAVVRRTFSMGLLPSKINPYKRASFSKFANSSYFVFYRTRTAPSMNNSTQYRLAPLNETVINGLPLSSIGHDLPPDQWREQFVDSKFCLVIRGDTPHSHALTRSIKAGCIPVIVCDSYPLYAPTLKSSIDMTEYAILLDEHQFLQDPLRQLLKLRELSETEIRMKLSALAFAQRIITPDSPDSLFVPAFLREALAADLA